MGLVDDQVRVVWNLTLALHEVPEGRVVDGTITRIKHLLHDLAGLRTVLPLLFLREEVIGQRDDHLLLCILVEISGQQAHEERLAEVGGQFQGQNVFSTSSFGAISFHCAQDQLDDAALILAQLYPLLMSQLLDFVQLQSLQHVAPLVGILFDFKHVLLHIDSLFQSLCLQFLSCLRPLINGL